MAESKESAGKPSSDKEKGDKAEVASPKAGAKGGNPMVFWGLVIGIALLEIPIMFFMIKLTRPKPAVEVQAEKKTDSHETKGEEEGEMGKNSPPIEILANVAGTDATRFIKVVAVLEYHDAKVLKGKEKKKGGHGGEAPKSEIEEMIDAKIPKFKAVLINLVLDKQLTELNDPAERDRMREEFRREVNKSLPAEIGSVSQVYFQEFIIQ